AYYFQSPVPRWADEGGSVLSEDDVERNRHDRLARQLLNAGRAMRLSGLFHLLDYPQDMMTLYAEGYSVTQYLVDQKDRATFRQFGATGMQGMQQRRPNWDAAVKTYYGFRSVDELEKAWIESLRQPRRPRNDQIAAQNRNPNAPASGELTGRVVTRTSVPPALPDLAAPVFRGQTGETERGHFGDAH